MKFTRKKILFVNRFAPYGSARMQEALDVVLMASTFEQEVSLLFVDDGVLLLVNKQNPEQILLKNFTSAFKAMPLYEITQVYVAFASLQERGLSATDLMLPVTLVSSEEVTNIIHDQDIIMNF